MSKESIASLSSFVSVTGSLKDRVRSSTGLGGVEALTERMHQRGDVREFDLLISNICNQKCPECFFREQGADRLGHLDQSDVEKVRADLQDFQHFSPRTISLYPREITTDLGLLEVFREQGINRVLTNGKLLGQQKVLDAFHEAGIEEMMVTVPGNSESFAAYTGEPRENYEKLLENIRTAITSGFRVDVFYPVMAKNIADIDETLSTLAKLGVSGVNFNRVIPTGSAKALPEDYFLTGNDAALEFLYRVNEARMKFDRRQIDISLYGLKMGPNFYNKNSFKTLAGEVDLWPHHLFEYLCPMVGEHYIGVSYETGDVYPCFQALSMADLKIGVFQNGEIRRSKSMPTTQELADNLRGQCAKDECEYQSLCLGGCRITAFAFAKMRGEQDPLFAGQDICITRILDELVQEQP